MSISASLPQKLRRQPEHWCECGANGLGTRSSRGMIVPTKIDNLPQLYLDDVRDRVYQKYEVTGSDATLAIEYLRCFFDVKRRWPTELIILPQIADWAWHELILDTERYRTICNEVFGTFLHHIAQTIHPDEPAPYEDSHAMDVNGFGSACNSSIAVRRSSIFRQHFRTSTELMRDIYGLGPGERPNEWLEAGWDRPIYRLRQPIQVPSHNHELYASSGTVSIDEPKETPNNVGGGSGLAAEA
jgi:hypothetical protein